MNKRRYHSKQGKYNPNDAFDIVKAFIPKETIRILKQRSNETGLPVSRLVAIAVDNEMDSNPPFRYDVELPTTDFHDMAYVHEGGKILNFLQKFPRGTTRTTLMLCRRDIGIPSRSLLMHAFRELLYKDLIEEFEGADMKTLVRMKGIDPALVNKQKFKRIEGISTKGERVIVDDDIESVE